MKFFPQRAVCCFLGIALCFLLGGCTSSAASCENRSSTSEFSRPYASSASHSEHSSLPSDISSALSALDPTSKNNLQSSLLSSLPESSVKRQSANSSSSNANSSKSQSTAKTSSAPSNAKKTSASSAKKAPTKKKSKSHDDRGSWDHGGTYRGNISIRENSAPGSRTYSGNGTVIDVSNAGCGYVMVRHSGASGRLKVQIQKDGRKYNYDLNRSGRYEAFPLQMGSGTYTVKTLENAGGNRYAVLYKRSFSVELSSSHSPFLYPNQYVNYNHSSAAVRKSFDLCLNAHSDLDKLKSIYNYLTSNIRYDYGKASSVSSGYIPNVDRVFYGKKGICFDYAALMAAMLRAQNVPCKLVIGSASGAPNHAWNEVYLTGIGWITIHIQNTHAGWKLMDATFGASGSSGSGYTAYRIY